MMKRLLPISSLLFGVALLLAGNGLFGTLLGVRSAAEGWSGRTIGLMMSAYFAGFLLGTFVNPRIITRVGHIRAFAIFAALASSAALLQGLLVHPLAWLLLRLLTGICLVGLYMVVESWLNAQAEPSTRGQVFAGYMAVNFGGLAAGQTLLALYPVQGFELFGVAAMLLSLSLVPVALTSVAQPTVTQAPHLSLRALYTLAPVGIAGAVGSGLALSAFWGMGPAAAQQLGFQGSGVAAFMSAAILGGALLQLPIGRWSDRGGDRRRVLFLLTLASAATALGLFLLPLERSLLLLGGMFLFGGLAFAIYPVSIALTNDRLRPEDLLRGAGSLLLLHGAGAVLGPFLAGLLMEWLGPTALMLHFALMLGLLATYAAWRLWISPQGPEAHTPFQPMVRTTPAALELIAPTTEDTTPEAGPAA
ncbi:MFS transporter [Solimonas sp. SE-A11]|uniref:MFS transporter n=1 Tax=Solimonas sp. SE-A11 TaxID=3054954 RepID=UPI00259D064A|nr:MFS transporter [Solimonas sp. SE-A11]MDM4769722.1 MFS transporter [Solimonas sp. SE-A11]